jgi:hypothetical protein
LTRRLDWSEAPAHSFFLVLAFAKWYPRWAKAFGRDFTEQGELFELVTRDSVQVLFPGWDFFATGWTRTASKKLKQVVSAVAERLGEELGQVERWSKPTANEAGLDLVGYRPFPDGRRAVPVLLFQCASGGDWDTKLHTPDLRIWGRIVNFVAAPKKAFATPFAFLDDEFDRAGNLVNGLLLDRYRILSASRLAAGWLSPDLGTRLVQWIQQRITTLPQRRTTVA